LWKKGIRQGDISLGNLMWDERRQVGVLNDFDLARFADQKGASGHDNTGTLPFMALDLLSEEGMRGEIPRRYRHEAESFAWSLICLYFATVKDARGENGTRDPHPLARWFTDWAISRDAKKALEWRDSDIVGVPLAHPNARDLACALHEYWVDRYIRQFPRSLKKDRPRLPPDTEQFPGGAEDAKIFDDEEVMAILNPPITQLTKVLPYEEPEDESLFRELVFIYSREVPRFGPTKALVVETSRRYNGVDWAA
jgi:hypothetical protein